METEATEVKTDQIIDDGEEKKIVEDRQNLVCHINSFTNLINSK